MTDIPHPQFEPGDPVRYTGRSYPQLHLHNIPGEIVHHLQPSGFWLVRFPSIQKQLRLNGSWLEPWDGSLPPDNRPWYEREVEEDPDIPQHDLSAHAPNLGVATTRELLEELSARIGHYRATVPGNLSELFTYLVEEGLEEEALNYRTVDQH